MYIHVSEIPPEGLEFPKGEPTAADLIFEGKDLYPLKVVKTAWLEFNVAFSGEDIILSGKCGAVVEFECDRCGDNVSREMECSFHKIFENQKVVEEAGDHELRREDLEVTIFDGEGFFLEDVIYEQLILSLPQKKLCADGCKGLCQLCGTSLNNDNCTCDRFEIDPRMEKLKKLLQDRE